MAHPGMRIDNRHTVMDMTLVPVECALSYAWQICCVIFFVAEAAIVVCHFIKYKQR